MSFFYLWNRRLHRWCSYALLVPILFWFASGIFMSWSDLNIVRGEHNQAKPVSFGLNKNDLFDRLPILDDIESLQVKRVGSRTLVWVKSESAGEALYDLDSGAKASPLDEAGARAVAEADFIPNAGIVSADFLTGTAPIDYRRRMPVWRVSFGDPEGTILYVDPFRAEVTARRTDHWRWFDFFWMLHIMDFEERSDINNPLLMIASALAGLFTVTGIILIVQHVTMRRRRH